MDFVLILLLYLWGSFFLNCNNFIFIHFVFCSLYWARMLAKHLRILHFKMKEFTIKLFNWSLIVHCEKYIRFQIVKKMYNCLGEIALNVTTRFKRTFIDAEICAHSIPLICIYILWEWCLCSPMRKPSPKPHWAMAPDSKKMMSF